LELDARDFVAHFMENWCFHKPTLQSLSKEGRAIPDEACEKLIASRKLMAGIETLSQVQRAMIDISLHNIGPSSSSVSLDTVHQIVKDISLQCSVPILCNTRSIASFSRIFTGEHCASYYSHLHSEALAASAFSMFERVRDDPEKLQEAGRKFAQTVLMLSGTLSQKQILHGRDPPVMTFLRRRNFLEE